jgi:hypothetical protein
MGEKWILSPTELGEEQQVDWGFKNVGAGAPSGRWRRRSLSACSSVE